MTILRAALLTLFALTCLPAQADNAPPVPDRRIVTVMGQDFYGGDIGSIMETDFDTCQKRCMATRSCKALTFNSAANACFLKSGVERSTPYEKAISARMVDTPAATVERAAERMKDLPFVQSWMTSGAERQARDLGLSIAANDLDPAGLRSAGAEALRTGEHAAAAQNYGAAASLTDAAADWIDYSRALAAHATADRGQRNKLRGEALSAAINGYLRAGSDGERATAARELADRLEARGYGRQSIPALRLSLKLADRRETQLSLDRALDRYGFRVVDHTIDSDAARPRVCVAFSEPLSEAGIDYQPFLRVEGMGELPVEPKGDQLCVEGVTHGQRFNLAVRAGLPSAEGEVLRKPVELEIYIRDRSPSARFVGRNYVLPRGAGAAIPIVTVNMSEVALKIHRIGDRNVLRTLQDDFFGEAIAEWREETIAQKLGAPVWEGVGEVERRVNEDVMTTLPVGEVIGDLKPGIYVMTARQEGEGDRWDRAATQWFVVTDLGLATMSGADGLHVFVRALSSAEAASGAKVQLLAANNEVLGEAVSDAQGYVRFAPGLTRGTGGMAPALVTVEGGEGDYAFLDLAKPGFDLTDRGVEGREAPGPVDLFVTTERGIYRPGEVLNVTVLARDGRADAIAGLPLTAIVSRPDGVEYTRAVLDDQGAGGRAWSLPIGGSVQRGTWTLKVHADPKAAPLSTTRFLVEDFVPEKIDLELDAPEGPVRADALPEIGIDVRYLYGAPGAGLEVSGRVRLTAVGELAGFPGFRFGLHDDAFSPVADSLPGAVTDENGRAVMPLVLPETSDQSRPLRLTAIVEASDGSGRPVERTLTRPVVPQRTLIGVKPLFDGAVETGGTARFEIAAVAPDGTRAAMDGIGWTVSRIDHDWIWYERDGRWDYEDITSRERIASDRIDVTPDGRAIVEVPVDWGQYEIKAVGGGADFIATSLEFNAGWWGAGGSTDTPDVLTMGLDRETYALGDIVKVRLKPRVAGKVLLAVVDNRLIETKVIDVTPGETEAELTVTPDWGPGAYVTATLVRPMDVAAGRNPSRALGLAWAAVDPGERRLGVEVTTPDEVSPRGPLEASVKVEGMAGEKAYVTLAAVDVGILNLTGFKAPDPDGYYFGQRKLGVEMRDLYGQLIDGLQGTRGRLRSGGDGGRSKLDAPPPTEDLVAFFSGVVEVGPDGTASATFTLPEFNGTVRVMAVAWTAKGVGHAEKDVLVRDPIVLSTALPRFLAPGDQSRLLMELAHAKGPAGNVGVEVTASGVTLGGNGGTVTLAEGGRDALTVPITAGAVGDARIVVVVTTPEGRKLTKTLTLGIRANDPEVMRQNRIPLAEGGRLIIDQATYDGYLPGTGRATLGVGPIAKFDAPGLLQALDRYPYGCTEQLTSRAMPLLYFSSVSEALGLTPREDTDERVASAIRAILQNQNSEGSFGLWRPDGGYDWLDAYVTDFLSRAKATGHAVPEQAFDAALTNLQNTLGYSGDVGDNGTSIAYALMVLAREGRASIGDLRYYADAKADEFRTPLAVAQLAAGLAYYGEQERADRLFRKAEAMATGQGKDDFVWRADYGSHLRDAAGVLALAAEAGSTAVNRDRLASLVTDPETNRRYYSTQEQVWMLMATNALARDPTQAVTLDGQPVDGPLVRLFEQGGPPAVIENTGAAKVEALLTTFGVPAIPPEAGGNGYEITRRYYALDGTEADVASVGQNARLVVVLTVKDLGSRNGRLMVDDPLPAGFEIDNPNLVQAGSLADLGWLSPLEDVAHSEFRSDRFLAAVDWNGGSFQLAYIVRAVSPGVFHHPAAVVEDMYRPTYRAWTGAGEVRVAAE